MRGAGAERMCGGQTMQAEETAAGEDPGTGKCWTPKGKTKRPVWLTLHGAERAKFRGAACCVMFVY